MALLDSEGFGMSGTLSDYLSYGVLATRGTGVITGHQQISTGGPLGDNVIDLYSAYFGGETPIYERIFNAAPTTFFFGCRTCFGPSGALSNGSGGFNFMDSAGVIQFSVQVDYLGNLAVYRGYAGDSLHGAGTSLGSASNVFAVDGSTYSYIEVGATIDGSTGSVVVKKNGSTVLTISSANTKNSSLANVGRVQFYTNNNTFQQQTTHIYFSDNSGSSPWNTYLGDVRVQTLLPTGDATVQFSHTGLGSNHANAANSPPVPGSDYNSDTVVGHQDTFDMAAISSGLTTVFGLNVKVLYQKADAGARLVQNVLVSSSTTATGTATGPGVTPSTIATMFETDPNTSAQWTQTNANAATPGYKINA